MYNAHKLSPYYKPTHKEKNVSGFFEPLHRKVIAAIVAVFLFVLLLASCTPRQQVAYGPAYAPAVVQQAPVVAAGAPVIVAPAVVHHDNGFGSAFAGSMLGSMVGNSFGRSSSHTTVVERHVTAPPVTTTSPAQRYTTPVPSYSPPVTQSYQSNRGVSTTVTSRPSTFGTTSGRASISVGRRR